ncbi:MAG: putative toxin-antitoxin system toxin component, PIN family [Candidatus Aenigmarchaeota archaeon]|nr:putative toxin-antitoxin system toxin component, PIN family [Candidatus Aenigmarchaeota archaeon]
MGKKATLDTNILVSSLGWKGPPHKAFSKIISGEVEMVISDEQFSELSEVLDYAKLEFTEEQKDRFKALILEVATFVKPVEKIDAVKDDPDDNMILECAVAGSVDYIVSGDQHLLNLKRFRGIKIVTAKQFLAEL